MPIPQNLTSRHGWVGVVSGTNATYSHGDQYSQNRLLSDGTYTYTYDGEGNLLTKSKSGEHVTYVWDHRNRLTKVENRTTAGGHNYLINKVSESEPIFTPGG